MRQLQNVLSTDDKVISMINFKGEIIVATTRGLYRLKEGKLSPIEFIYEEERKYEEQQKEQEDASSEV